MRAVVIKDLTMQQEAFLEQTAVVKMYQVT